jgi:hypothetical protein
MEVMACFHQEVDFVVVRKPISLPRDFTSAISYTCDDVAVDHLEGESAFNANKVIAFNEATAPASRLQVFERTQQLIGLRSLLSFVQLLSVLYCPQCVFVAIT